MTYLCPLARSHSHPPIIERHTVRRETHAIRGVALRPTFVSLDIQDAALQRCSVPQVIIACAPSDHVRELSRLLGCCRTWTWGCSTACDEDLWCVGVSPFTGLLAYHSIIQVTSFARIASYRFALILSTLHVIHAGNHSAQTTWCKLSSSLAKYLTARSCSGT